MNVLELREALREALGLYEALGLREDGMCLCGAGITQRERNHAPGCRYVALRRVWRGEKR